MFHDDFLRVTAQALGIKTPEGATITEQENAILAAIAKLKRKQVQNRPPSAPADRARIAKFESRSTCARSALSVFWFILNCKLVCLFVWMDATRLSGECLYFIFSSKFVCPRDLAFMFQQLLLLAFRLAL